MNLRQHAYIKRIGPGDVWQCQAKECKDKGPIRELKSRECKRTLPLTPSEAKDNLLDAIGSK